MTIGDLPGVAEVDADPIELARRAADWLVETCRGIDGFGIALAGGSTPRLLFETLATAPHRGRIDWSRWHIFFGDERAVPPDHPDSNYRLAAETLLARVGVPPDQVHRMEADRAGLDGAAADYSRLLARERGDPPRLDVVLLGIGADGHTASLFPGTPALDVTDTWCTRGRATYQPFDRTTLTFPAINAAADVAFLVTGAGKSAALRGVIGGTVPAARVRPLEGGLRWFLDSAAAAGIG